MSPARRRLFLLLAGLLALVVAVTVTVIVVAATGGKDEPAPLRVAAVDQARPGTVLLIPGYGGSTSALRVLAARLRAAGHQSTVIELPGEGTGDLRGYTALVDAAAQAALRAGSPSVDVVGYSAGGVVARLWAKEGGVAVARRIVTLGGPHHGTQLAALGASLAPGQCPQACRQLVPGSALLNGLNAGDETPDGPAWLSLWTTVDQTVTPPDSAHLEGATNVVLQDVCPAARTTHSDLPRDRSVQGIVLAALGSGPVTVPTTCPR